MRFENNLQTEDQIGNQSLSKQHTNEAIVLQKSQGQIYTALNIKTYITKMTHNNETQIGLQNKTTERRATKQNIQEYIVPTKQVL